MHKKDLMEMFEFKSRTLNPQIVRQILPASGRAGTSAARDYISAICLLTEYAKAVGSEDPDLSRISSKNDLWNAIHPATKFRLRHYTPCLAARYDELKEPQQKQLFDDPNWVATCKENGVRAWVICYKGEMFMYSRNYSDVDCGLLEYSKNIFQSINQAANDIAAFDCELKFEPGTDISSELEELGIATDSPLEAMVAMLHTYPESAQEIQKKFKERFGKDLIVFRLIAPLYLDGKNYLNRTLGEGMQVYNQAIEHGREMGLNLMPIDRCEGTREEKEIFLDTIINNNGEGVVFHNKLGNYCTSDNRSKTSFIKLKRSIKATFEQIGMGDTFDAFVGGFTMGSNGAANEGIIGALNFYIYINKSGNIRKHWIASVPNITREERLLATWNNADGLYPQEWTDSNGETHWVSLNPDFDGLVGELNGQALSARSVRLEHPSLVMWRTERSSESCIYTQEFIDSQTTASAHNTGTVSY